MSDLPIVGEHARRLIYSYARAVDRLDRALLGAIFHADAHVELGEIYRGRPEGFLDVAMGFMGAMAMTRHDVSNVLILDHGATHADVESYVQAWHRIETQAGTRELTVYGRYLTRIEARGDVWRISRHSEVIDWGREVAADPTWFDTNGEMTKGTRDASDASHGFFMQPQ